MKRRKITVSVEIGNRLFKANSLREMNKIISEALANGEQTLIIQIDRA